MQTMEEEVKDTLPSFPYSHRRTDSSLGFVPTKRASLRRTNSVVRTGKDIIPLVLTAEVASPDVAAGTSYHGSSSIHRHRRGLSVGLSRSSNTAATASRADERRARPSSVFFDRFFNATPAASSSSTSQSPLEATTLFQQQRPGLLARSSSTSGSSTRSAALSAQGVSSCICACNAAGARQETSGGETRALSARIANLEAEKETRDLTISMLSEQLLDKDQELELMRCKVAGLESALTTAPPYAGLLEGGMNPNSGLHLLTAAAPPPHLLNQRRSPLLTHEEHEKQQQRQRDFSGRDSAIGSADSSSGSPTLSHLDSPVIDRSNNTTTHLVTATGAGEIVVSGKHDAVVKDEVTALREQNAALMAEITRLNAALDDGLGALSDLGI